MIRNRLFRLSILGLFLGVFACAEPVSDIDRTQGNLVRKADLEGEWYLMQTITGVPATTWFTFVGETSRMERVRWEVQRDLLVAYRSYPRVPGSTSPSTARGFDGTENPVAAYRIESHVDVRRDYNPTTGEQSNVIVENTSDRQWFEREFVRVDWSASEVTNFDFIAPTGLTEARYFVPEEQGQHDPDYLEDAFYREMDNSGSMHYFDVLGKLFVTPDIWGCIYTWWGYAAEDCAAGEIEVRTSFSRVPTENDYEAFHYNDQLMSRFGYFRTEYFTYDEQRGITDMGRRYMINRHNIWEQSKDGDRVIPIPERTLRTVPYYLSRDFPDDPLLHTAARESVSQWNDAMRAGLNGLGVSDTKDVFVLCSNPVAEDDPEACGSRGFSPRIGDLRYSTLHWVDTETLAGLLGYGPAGADPITGEVVSGKAYVYGAAISTWATYAVDIIRYFNGDLELNTLVNGHHFVDDVQARLANLSDTIPHADGLDRTSLRRPITRPDRPARPEVRREDLRAYDRRDIMAKLDRAQAAGGRAHSGNVEVQRALARTRNADWDELPEHLRDRLDPTTALNPTMHKQRHAHRKQARARGVDFHDMLTPNIEGLVRSFAGRTDYEAMWREVRAEIFAATAEHEVGHTLGLRHNFQGSYDSLNFHEEYWQLRQENLFPAESLGDVYRLTKLTDEQHAGQMRQHQYSSIMDYGFSWQNDLTGLGKYDRAALVFGYTSGSYQTNGEQCEQYPSTSNDEGCIALLPGLVEVFKKRQTELGRAGEILADTEDGFSYDDPGLPSITALERYHYTTVALGFPELDDMLDIGREWMNYADFLSGKADANRAVRVPYLFCSDEWEGGLVSCHAFDQGADPFEIVRSKTAHYRAYYPFVNYRMDRPFFEVWYPLDSYFYRIFLPLSDVFQSWYVAPWGDDDLFDRTYDLAITSAFNLLAEVLSTPAYGQWCENDEGQLVHLSDEPVLQGEAATSSVCVSGGRRVYVPPGEGRRRFSIYDVNSGYYFPDKPQEAGHYWATLAAIWAITDPEAYVLGVDGDAGTYAISFYDWFTDEFTDLMNDLVAKDYAGYAPTALLSSQSNDDGSVNARMRYQPRIPVFNRDTGAEYDPETGLRADPTAGGDKSLCESCQESSECLGYTGRLGGVYCQPISDGADAFHCLKDCSYGPDACPAGTVCRQANCVPEDAACGPLIQPCSPEWPFGQCAEGRCLDGACVETPVTHPVRAERTFMLATDILWYGFLYTTSSFSTAFNDQFNVFRPGTARQVEVDDADAAARISFTNPLSGVAYAAVQSNCPEINRFVLAGEQGLCGRCEDDRQCAGYNGELGGTWCQPVADSDETYCLTDCSEDESNCGDGEICDDIGNCVPEAGVCGPPTACSAMNPLGSCSAGSTCIEGSCVPATCLYDASGDTGAVRLIKRGQELVTAYNLALSNWYRFDDDPELEAQYGREYYRSRYELQNHIDLLETLLATYNIFGSVY